MKPSIALHQNRAAIRAVVERHRAHNARVLSFVEYILHPSLGYVYLLV